ncbi:MAG: hypothetical protein V1754_07365, partial [Pseudomonadota bacterium]
HNLIKYAFFWASRSIRGVLCSVFDMARESHAKNALKDACQPPTAVISESCHGDGRMDHEARSAQNIFRNYLEQCMDLCNLRHR